MWHIVTPRYTRGWARPRQPWESDWGAPWFTAPRTAARKRPERWKVRWSTSNFPNLFGLEGSRLIIEVDVKTREEKAKYLLKCDFQPGMFVFWRKQDEDVPAGHVGKLGEVDNEGRSLVFQQGFDEGPRAAWVRIEPAGNTWILQRDPSKSMSPAKPPQSALRPWRLCSSW